MLIFIEKRAAHSAPLSYLNSKGSTPVTSTIHSSDFRILSEIRPPLVSPALPCLPTCGSARRAHNFSSVDLPAPLALPKTGLVC